MLATHLTGKHARFIYQVSVSYYYCIRSSTSITAAVIVSVFAFEKFAFIAAYFVFSSITDNNKCCLFSHLTPTY